jgi:cytochrome c biogenesis protein CcmG/thiol:disulfide interchange protein DsbE
MNQTSSVQTTRKARLRMHTSRSPAGCGILIALLLAAAAVHAAPPKASLLDKPAPPFSRTSLDNQRVDLSALRGRVVLLNFWATWCAPCQIEMPRFVQWQQKYKSEGLSIVGVSMDDGAGPVVRLTRKLHINYPIFMGDEKLGLAYGGILGLPVTYLIDREGVIRARYQGQTDLAAMEKRIHLLLSARE